MRIELATLDKTSSSVVAPLLSIINRAYQQGEAGICVHTEEHPFVRVSQAELEDWIRAGQVLVAIQDNHEVVGCVKVYKVAEALGEWGCLAVDASATGKGVGSQLVKAAEESLHLQQGCTSVQLEILSPRHQPHAHKDRVRAWYTKLGYQATDQVQYFAKGDLLFGSILMAADNQLLTYRRDF